jgi:hypothetical protein
MAFGYGHPRSEAARFGVARGRALAGVIRLNPKAPVCGPVSVLTNFVGKKKLLW